MLLKYIMKKIFIWIMILLIFLWITSSYNVTCRNFPTNVCGVKISDCDIIPCKYTIGDYENMCYLENENSTYYLYDWECNQEDNSFYSDYFKKTEYFWHNFLKLEYWNWILDDFYRLILSNIDYYDSVIDFSKEYSYWYLKAKNNLYMLKYLRSFIEEKMFSLYDEAVWDYIIWNIKSISKIDDVESKVGISEMYHYFKNDWMYVSVYEIIFNWKTTRYYFFWQFSYDKIELSYKKI